MPVEFRSPQDREIYQGIPGGCLFFGSSFASDANAIAALSNEQSRIPLTQISGQMQYAEIDTLVVIYPNYYKDATVQMHLSSSDIEILENEVRTSQNFIWRSSNLKCLMKTDFLIIDRALTLNDLWDFGGGSYWLHQRYWGEQAVTVEEDLHTAGIADYQYSVILVLYAFENSTGATAAIGGGTYGVYSTMGDAAYIAIPLAWGLNCDGTVTHEYLHALDSIFEASGNPGGNDMHHTDHPESLPYVCDSGQHLNFLVCNTLDPESWLLLNPLWAAVAQTADSDNDNVPDSGVLPITEESIGSNDADIDTDNDGLDDLEELICTYYSSSDLLSQDTESDGMLDGTDPYPLCTFNNYSLQRQPVINGIIAPGEYSEIVQYNKGNTDIAVTFYADWLDDTLFIAAMVTDDMLSTYYTEPWWSDNIEINIDVEKDGWLVKGSHNFQFYAIPRGLNNRPDIFGYNYYYDPGNDAYHPIDVSSLNAKYVLQPGGYSIELAIPASVLTGVTIANNASIRLSFQVEDYDTYPGWPRFNAFNGQSDDNRGFVELELLQSINKTDINNDKQINLNDLSILISQWLQPPRIPSADIFPSPSDGFVNFLDFAALADNWLDVTAP